MRAFICISTLTASLMIASMVGAQETGGVAPPADSTAPAAAAPAGDATAPAPEGAAPPAAQQTAPGTRFKPAPSRGIQPTVSRLPSYWSCQDNLDRRLVVTYLDTKTPSVILERGSKKVIATLKTSKGVGSKWMAPGGVLFWERGKQATLQWGSANAASCASLGG